MKKQKRRLRRNDTLPWLNQSYVPQDRYYWLIGGGRFLRRSEIAAFFTRPTRYGCFLVALMLLIFLTVLAIVIAISTFQMFGLSWWFLGTLSLVLGLIGLVAIISRQLGRIARNRVPPKHRKKNHQ